MLKKILLIIIIVYMWRNHQAEVKKFYDWCLPFTHQIEKKVNEWRGSH